MRLDSAISPVSTKNKYLIPSVTIHNIIILDFFSNSFQKNLSLPNFEKTISLIIVENRPSISCPNRLFRCLKSIIPLPPLLSLPFFLPLPFHSTLNRTSFFASISIQPYRFTIFYHLANHCYGQFHRYKHRYSIDISIYFPLRRFLLISRFRETGKKRRQINRSFREKKKERKIYFVVGILRSLAYALLHETRFPFSIKIIQTVLHNWKQELFNMLSVISIPFFHPELARNGNGDPSLGTQALQFPPSFPRYFSTPLDLVIINGQRRR